MTILKTSAEIEIMAEAGRRLANILRELRQCVRPGGRTLELDEKAEALIRAVGAVPAFLHYRPGGAKKAYPATLCASVNEGIVHGLPSDRKLISGDLLTLDLGLIYEGWYADAAITMAVGEVSTAARALVSATAEALARAVRQARPGQTLGDIGWAVEQCARQKGFSVVESLTGHGIGRALHEDPFVFNVGPPGQGEKLTAGMVLAIEPMLSAGDSRVRQLADDSFATADGSLSAHFEHTVAITAAGPRILTQL